MTEYQVHPSDLALQERIKQNNSAAEQSIRDTKRMLRKRAEQDKETMLDVRFRKRLVVSGFANIAANLAEEEAIKQAIIEAKGMAAFSIRRHLPYDYTVLEKIITTEVYKADKLVCTYTELWWM
jgi:hypothetical protein